MPKILIAYYSRTGENYVSGQLKMLKKGNTEVVAEKIAALTGGELFKIEQVKPYATGYNDCIEQARTDQRSNEIPAVQELIRELDIAGCMVVADAMHCQQETAEEIIHGKGDYLLSVKGNQPTLEKEIADYVNDNQLREGMQSKKTVEKNRDRLESRTAYISSDIAWLFGREKWANLACIGAIKTECRKNGEETCEWHYYISSRMLSPSELLHHARMEWAVETMHWFLDVHFGEDYCRIENKTIQQNFNMLRKFSLNLIKLYKQRSCSKRPLSNIMFDCLLNPSNLCSVLVP